MQGSTIKIVCRSYLRYLVVSTRNTNNIPFSSNTITHFQHHNTLQSNDQPKHKHLIRKMGGFYGEELLAPRPNPKLENHPLSSVFGYFFKIFAPIPHIGGWPSICNLRTRNAMMTRKGEVYKVFWWGNLRERDHLWYPDADARIILSLIFRKCKGMGWI
jgi:hypothetical protein